MIQPRLETPRTTSFDEKTWAVQKRGIRPRGRKVSKSVEGRGKKREGKRVVKVRGKRWEPNETRQNETRTGQDRNGEEPQFCRSDFG